MKLSKSAGVVLLASASVAFFLAGELYDGGSFEVESSQGEDYGSDWRGDGGKVVTSKRSVAGRTGTKTKDESFTSPEFSGSCC